LEVRFCDVCGHNIEKELKERGMKNDWKANDRYDKRIFEGS
jgi:hypothetical protein